MKRVYRHDDRFMVWQIKQLLEARGIPCFIKNEFAIGAVGELSPFDVLPEVWLSDDEWWPKAQQLISEFEMQAVTGSGWVCQQCQEFNDVNFELCWQCGVESDSQS